MPRFVSNAIVVQSQWNNNAQPTIVISQPIMDRSIHDCSLTCDTDWLVVDRSAQCGSQLSCGNICWERGYLRGGLY